MLFHSSTEAFLNCVRVVVGFWRFLTLLSRSSYICSMEDKSGLYGGQSSGTMLFFDRNPDKLCLHVSGYCPAVKSADVAAREGLQRGEGSHPCTLLLSYCPLQQSTVLLPHGQCSPDHNGATPKPIPFDKASWAVNHAIRRNRRAWVRGGPTYGRLAWRPLSRNRFRTVFGEIRRLWVTTVLRAVSVAVMWQLRKCAKRTFCPVWTSRRVC